MTECSQKELEQIVEVWVLAQIGPGQSDKIEIGCPDLCDPPLALVFKHYDSNLDHGVF